jgi:predicted sulfurtransferase
MDIERLERKLARAVRDGRGARVEELSARLAAAKAVAKAARRAAKRAAAAASTEAVGAAVKASEGSDGEIEQRSARRAARRAEKERVAAAAAAAAAIAPSAAGAPLPAPGEPAPPAPGMVLAKNGKWYPAPVPPPPGNVTLLLFYAYVVPPWTRPERSAAADFARATLARLGCTGRLRVALEGFNATLTGPAEGIRGFTAALREFSPRHFGATDFKYVDGLQDNKAFRELKVMPVDELVTYGFKASEAPLEYGGRHVKPEDWTRLAAQPDTVMIDVRNANETAIGRFAPPPQGAQLLDPHMRRSTEFPEWVDSMLPALKEKKTVMMYCTAGVRCERASALLVQKGVPREAIVQLEGGIHRYLEAYPEDGGIWAGKN